MDAHQLVNSLTSHISLYHQSSSNPNYISTHRSAILKWFSSLTVDQRQAYLTIVDPNFVHLLICMQDKLQSHGHGFFLLLPDLPSSHCPSLPSLCYRKSQGLLARVSERNNFEMLVLESVRLFGSKEGENVKESSFSVDGLDSMTVCEDFVVDVDRFLAVMDGVSNNEFLRGEECGLDIDWAEMKWLKAKGYYSIEAFVVNRLEISLRFAWQNCIGYKRRGGKMKEKLSSETVGVAVNVFRRKMGCVHWWGTLNEGTQAKVISLILGRSANSLVEEILKGVIDDLGDGKQIISIGDKQSLLSNCAVSSVNAKVGVCIMPVALSKKINPFFNAFNHLLVLLEILSMFSSCRHGGLFKQKFFSTLSSVRTISDYVLRKLRGLLMSVSLDLTQRQLLGLLGDENLNCVGAGKRRKKKRTRNIKKVDSALSSHSEDLMHKKIIGDQGCGLASVESESRISPEKHVPGETIYSEHANGLVGKQGQPSVRQGRKRITKNRTRNIIERENAVRRDSEFPRFSIVSQGQTGKSCHESSSSVIKNITGDDDSCGIVDHGPTGQSIHVSCNKNSNNLGSECDQVNCSVIENGIISTGSETPSSFVKSNVSFGVKSVLETDIVSKESISFSDSRKLNESDNEFALSVNPIDGFDKEKTVSSNKQRNGKIFESRPICFRDCPSHEWPCIDCTDTVQFPCSNTHLPAATDGLHFDQSYHNHFRQAFVNTAIEGGCSQILPRQLSMSLDWPPMLQSIDGLTSPFTYTYDSGFVPGTQSSFWQGLAANNIQPNATINNMEKKYTRDYVDTLDFPNTQEIANESENHFLYEEEQEKCAVSGVDYSQYFGGGVMYWNTSDYPGNSSSRPPSLGSDDNSAHACREADMNRAVDDMVAFSSSYSTNGLTSPTASPFCSSYDSLGPGHQSFGYVMPSNDVYSSLKSDSVEEESTSGSLANISRDFDGKTCDSLPYPVLRPIIIPNFSNERSRSEFRHKSPCVPPARREQPRIKRPPSPVVLCVSQASHPPPPSPASDSRNPRGFSAVRSGSSSPRHGGMRGWFQDESNFEEACMDDIEVVWPSWRNKNIPARPVIQPLAGSLLQDRLMAISEHPDVAIPLRPADLANNPTRKASLSLLHNLLHDEIDSLCKKVAAMNALRKPYINWAVKRVTRSLQVLWPRSRSNIFGSNATGLSLPTSDVDLVVCLPPVRNLEPIKEAGILEGRNGIKETCLQHAARYLANQEWVKSDSLKTVENTAIPIIMLVVEVPQDLIAPSTSHSYAPEGKLTLTTSEEEKHVHNNIVGLKNSVLPMFSKINCDHGNNLKAIRLDISFKSSSHTGLQTTELVRELTDRFPAVTPLASVLKMFLADRSLDQSYSGGLSSYCLVLLIIRFIQHQHHLDKPINQNYGSLLMDFLYFYGNIFDPRQMRISVLGSGVYINRERGYSIDPIHIDDPLFPTNNVGRNCFRIHQCIKAFSDAFVVLENEVTRLCSEGDSNIRSQQRVLNKIVPSIDDF